VCVFPREQKATTREGRPNAPVVGSPPQLDQQVRVRLNLASTHLQVAVVRPGGATTNKDGTQHMSTLKKRTRLAAVATATLTGASIFALAAPAHADAIPPNPVPSINSKAIGGVNKITV